MKVLLLDERTSCLRVISRSTNPALMSLGSALGEQKRLGLGKLNLEVAVDRIDYKLKGQTTEEAMKKHEPDLVGLSVDETNFTRVCVAVREIKRISKNTCVVLGGPFATALPHTVLLKSGADALLRGDAEFSFRRFVEQTMAGKACDDIDGVVLQEHGKVVPTPWSSTVPVLQKETLAKIDTDYELLERTISGCGFNRINAVTSRGCSFGNCSYCSISQRRTYRRPHDEVIMSELKALERFGLEIYVQDPLFGGPPVLLKRLLAGMDGRFSKLSVQLSVDQLLAPKSREPDSETIEMLRKAGIVRVFLGVEFLCDSMLERMKAGRYTAKEAEGVMLALARAGIRVIPYTILSDVMATDEEIAASMKAMERVATTIFEEKLPIVLMAPLPYVNPFVGTDYYAYLLARYRELGMKIYGKPTLEPDNTQIPYYDLLPIPITKQPETEKLIQNAAAVLAKSVMAFEKDGGHPILDGYWALREWCGRQWGSISGTGTPRFG